MRFAPRLLAIFLIGLGTAACERGTGLPDPDSPRYVEAVSAFYTGVAALQAGESALAETEFQRVVELAPSEPAAWADLGLTALHRREVDAAADRIERAAALAPENGRIQLLAAIVARERGRLDAARQHLRNAIELEPGNLRALFLLAQIVEQEDSAGSVVEARQLVDSILAVQPDNLAALLERARLAAKEGDVDALGRTLDRVDARVATAGSDLAEAIDAARDAARTGEHARAATQLAFVQNRLQQLPAFRDDQAELMVSTGGADLLFTRFLRLPSPTARPAPPDTSVTFAAEPLAMGGGGFAWIRSLWLGDEVPLALLALDSATLWISTQPGQAEPFPLPGGAAAAPLSASPVASLDYDHDFRFDLAVAGAGGVRLLHQDRVGTFADVTEEALPPAVAGAAYAGAWAADLDLEGDVDLILAPVEGSALALRNRGDGSFEPYPTFVDVNGLRDFAWTDLDADGDPDAVLLDRTGRLHVFLNGRSRIPQFQPLALPDTLGIVHAIAAADVNQDATVDLAVLLADGRIELLSLHEAGWQTETIARWRDAALPSAVGSARLFLSDLDNNGDVDLVASTPAVTAAWLKTSDGLQPLPPIAARTTDVVDLDGDGRLDFIGVAPDATPQWLVNRGTLDYFSTTIRPRAADASGDRRINTFGIGGEVEIRAGLLYQKQPIVGPAVHFGLGDHAEADVARILWPNGTVQAEFDLSGTNAFVLTVQRLKGSCPWVFAFDGEAMRFVTDFLWRTALGLRINAQGKAAVIHGEDWILLRGDQLAARDGFYDIRITAELWETHFFDHVSLMTVDHPSDTEVFVDERFTLPAPEPAVHAVEPLRPVAAAWDHHRREVTDLIRDRDERYLDTFELGRYQGIAEEHYVEVELGNDVPADTSVWLVASGWVYPTDASINVAVSQGTHASPRGLRLEVPDGEGGWVVIHPDLGFPSGKTKTILVDLKDAFRPGAERRLRLSTNMEIYWDRIAWTVGRPGGSLETRRLLPASADLRYRGFSAVHQAGRTAPELPVYDDVATTVPLWRDLVGYYTRFGDVTALNETVDDRYVIMNAGDELVLRFPAPPPPPDGWTRDYVLIGDGWVKDGDYNTGFSDVVLPLPYHGMRDYAEPPRRLEDDPAYRKHPDDWKNFHTRYVTPREFHHALVPERHD